MNDGLQVELETVRDDLRQKLYALEADYKALQTERDALRVALRNLVQAQSEDDRQAAVKAALQVGGFETY